MLYIDRVEDVAFHYMTYSHTLAQEPLPRGHDINSLVDPSFVINTLHVLNLSDPTPSVYKKRRRNIAFLYVPMSQLKNPAPGAMKFTICVDSSLVIITILSVCLIYAWV